MRELDINDIADAAASEGLYDEANANKTVPTGTYNFRYQGVTPQESDSGTQSLRFNVAFLDDHGQRKGSGFFSVEWVERRAEGRDGTTFQVRECQLYGQMLRAFGLGKTDGPKAVINAFQNAYGRGFVLEKILSPEHITGSNGKRISHDVLDTANMAAKDLPAAQKRINDGKAIARDVMPAYLEDGWKAFNNVLAFGKAK